MQACIHKYSVVSFRGVFLFILTWVHLKAVLTTRTRRVCITAPPGATLCRCARLLLPQTQGQGVRRAYWE